MYRRHLLAAVGAGLPGCLGRERLAGETGTPTPASTSPLPLSVSVEAVQRPSGFDAAAVTVVVTEPAITRSHTATVSIGFENVGDEAFEVVAGRKFPFSPTVSEDGRWGLLYSADAATRSDEECWEPEASYDAFARHLSEHGYELLPGERQEVQRWLWSYPKADICMPTSVTTFRTDGTVDPLADDVEIEWGFDLHISPG